MQAARGLRAEGARGLPVHFLDTLRNHRERIDLNGRLLEAQRRIGAELVGDYHPSQRKLARQHVPKGYSEGLSFIGLRFVKHPFIN